MLRQIFVVSAINFKSLRSRFWQSMVIVVGLAATIGVLLSMLSVTAGMRQAYVKAGDPGRAIVVSKGADSEGQSSITRTERTVVMDAPGIAKDKDGRPLADRACRWACRCCARTAARAIRPCAAWPQGRGAAARIPSGPGPHVPARQA